MSLALQMASKGEKVVYFAYPVLNEVPYEYNPKEDYDMSGVTLVSVSLNTTPTV